MRPEFCRDLELLRRCWANEVRCCLWDVIKLSLDIDMLCADACKCSYSES